MEIAETFVTMGVVARRLGDGFHSLRHRHLPTSNADSSRTTTWVSSASVAAVVTVLCREDDCFASQLRLVLMKIPTFADFGKLPKLHQKLKCCMYCQDRP